MKTPTWATAIGIIMIVLGGCGAVNDIKSIALPAILAEQRGRIKEEVTKEYTADSLARQSSDSLARPDEDDEEQSLEEEQKKVEEILTLSQFTQTWIVRFGYIGVASSLLFILGGVFLLVKRNFSIMLAYAVLVVSILSSGAQAAVLTSSSSTGVIALSTGLSQLLGVIVDIVLLAIIFASDKEAYQFLNNQS